MNQKDLNNLIKYIAVCATAFVVVLVGVITFQRIKYHNINKEITSLDNKIAQIEQQRTDLENKIEYQSSQIYLEEYARNQLGLIASNETYFEIIEK